MLVMVFRASSFLDNIAAALIGARWRTPCSGGRCTLAIWRRSSPRQTRAARAAWSATTTTTMMWIDGVDPLDVFEAYVGASVALLICGIPAAMQQQRHSPILSTSPRISTSTGSASGSLFFVLVAAIVTNVS